MRIRKCLGVLLMTIGLCVAVVTPYYLAHAENGTAICSAQTNTGSNIGTCINRIYVISLAVGGILAVLIFVIAGYRYMQGGSEQKAAITMAESAIVGLVILFGTYLFLNTINPDLTSFTGLSLPTVSCTGGSATTAQNICAAPTSNLAGAAGATGSGTSATGSTTPTTPTTSTTNGTSSPQSQSAAKILLNDNGNGITLNASSSQCPGNSPLQEVTNIANGTLAQFDSPNGCANGYTDLSVPMLSELHTLAASNLSVTVTALANGHHSSTTDPHYQGRAVDMVPADSSQQTAIVQNVFQNGATKVGLECVGQSYFALSPTVTTSSNCHSGMSGYHLHAQW